MHEVSLAQSRFAVHEERVVGASGSVGQGDGCRVGQLAVGADDEILEGVSPIEAGFDWGPLGGLDGRPVGAGAWALGHRLPGDPAVAVFIGWVVLKCDRDLVAEEPLEGFGKQVQVVVVDPNRGKFVGYLEHHGVALGAKALNGSKPAFEDIVGQ